jgi:hypothetical protein
MKGGEKRKSQREKAFKAITSMGARPTLRSEKA